MDATDAPEPLYDLGVLFVHGIGQSAQGETLVHFGEPLRAAIERLAAPAVGPNAPATPDLARVTSAWLSDADAARPARAELRIDGVAPRGPAQGAAAATSSRWLLAEAWWAKKFPTPTYAEIVSWSLGVLPATLVAHFDRRFRRIGYAWVRAWRDGDSALALLAATARLLLEGVGVVLALALTPLLLLAIGALLVLGLIPLATTRDLAASLQRKLAATVGDSYVFMHQRVTAATICTAVQERLEWLAARCRKVAVVAHSQGGAIAHRVLRGPVTAPCDLLITFGSGLAKLSEIERGDASRGQGALWFASFGALLSAACVGANLWLSWQAAPGALGLLEGLLMPFTLLELGGVVLIFLMARLAGASSAAAVPGAAQPPQVAARTGVRLWPPLAFGIVASAVSALYIGAGDYTLDALWPEWPLMTALGFGLASAYEGLTAWQGHSGRSIDPERQWLRDRELFLEHFEIRHRRMYWYDLYATADPVSNGHLLDEFDPRKPHSIEVWNRDSLLADHTTYWQSDDDFVHRVADALLYESGLATRPLLAGRAARRRAWRVRWLAAGRRLIGFAALALAAQWSASTPDWIASKAGDWLPAVYAVDGSRRAWAEALQAGAPSLAAIVVWLLLMGALQVGWRIWERHEIDDYANGRDYRLGPPGLWFTLAAPLLMLGIVLHLFGGTRGVVALLGLLLLTAAAWRAWPALRHKAVRESRSGTGAGLDALDLVALRAQVAAATRRKDKVALTQLGLSLAGLDDALARQALHSAAFDLRHANAAWALGQFHDRAAELAGSDADRDRELRLAIEAFRQGADIGDPLSARWAAYKLDDVHDKTGAQEMYRRAFDLGDADSAHAVGLRLIKQGRRDEARQAYLDGVRRGDSLSASALGGLFESDANAADGAAALPLYRQAADLYRVAFDLGDVSAAVLAGDLLRRRLRDIAGARKAYAAGVRLRDAFAALRLGQLEHHEEDDFDAALPAYEAAIRLDTLGSDAAEARLGLGEMLEARGRLRAAKGRYREALWTPRGRHVSAQAGLALARLLEADGYRGEKEAQQALERASTLEPRIAADAYLAWLDKHYKEEEIAALTPEQIGGLGTLGLLRLSRLLRNDEPQRARALLEEAARRPDTDASEAIAELHGELYAEGATEALARLLDSTAARDPWFVGKVADAMKERGHGPAADALRARADKG